MLRDLLVSRDFRGVRVVQKVPALRSNLVLREDLGVQQIRKSQLLLEIQIPQGVLGSRYHPMGQVGQEGR